MQKFLCTNILPEEIATVDTTFITYLQQGVLQFAKNIRNASFEMHIY